MIRMAKKSPGSSSPEAIELETPGSDNLTRKMNSQDESNKPSIHGVAKAGKRERAFELSLPAVVTGVDFADNRFREKTILVSISSEEAAIWLRSKVASGAKLNVSLDIPKTLILENHLQLQLTGTVAPNGPDLAPAGKKKVVWLRLDRKFRLLPVAPSVN
jgi:hypothetical protein